MFKNKSLLGNYWHLQDCDERDILYSSQKNNISTLLAKLLYLRNIDDNLIDNYLSPNIKKNFPDPFLLKDMERSVNRTISALNNNEKIGIIADYDVDGSTSASILFKFLYRYANKIIVKTPNRLLDGYGPNLKIMDEMLSENINLIFTLDCGTTSYNILDNPKYSKIDIIVIDHHLSEEVLPKVFSIINPNRYDESEDHKFTYMAAVGVTFLFLMALRKMLRDNNFFKDKFNEPNLINFLDLVALGTICDVVKLTNYNRVFVKTGLELIKERKNINITKMIDNSNLNFTPSSTDIGYIIGPQLNAASRLDDSSLPVKFLISNNIEEIETISKKLLLLNEKRKLIQKNIFELAFKQAEKQKDQNFILVYGNDWHNGVLGIVASKLINIFYKPCIVISFSNSNGVGSARSIDTIDLGNIIIKAKNKKILISGGGHKMAAGLKIKFNLLDTFSLFLKQIFNKLPTHHFKKIEYLDSIISINEININLLETINKIEPFGSGNLEPKFIINDVIIENIKILKNKHILIFIKNDFSTNLKAVCFNCINTILGDYLLNFNKHKFAFSCNIKRDNFKNTPTPQIIIKDAIIID